MNKSEKVMKLLVHCLYKDEELIGKEPEVMPEGCVKVEGIVCDYGFHPERLAAKKEEIRDILDEMPDDFHAHGGGGTSFLSLCMDKAGDHWAEHPTMGALIALGIGVGLAEYVMPRKLWKMLPGGMPYVRFDTAA